MSSTSIIAKISISLNISLKSFTLLTATFFEWNMKEDFPGYILLPLMYMNIFR